MNKKTIKAISISVVISGLIFTGWYFSLLNSWQEKLLDAFFVKKAPDNSIVIFAIDNESISSIGQWPWSREIFAKALQHLQSAKVVAVDVNFSEASKTDPLGDAALAEAITASKPSIILPVHVDQKTQEKTEPLSIFKQNSYLGSVDVVNDDGMARKVENTSAFISFGALAASKYQSGLQIPNMVRVDYAGAEKTFVTLPIHDLLDGNVPENLYAGKLVLIGSTAPDLHDFFQTPFGLLPGVEINANVASTVLAQHFYQDVSWYVLLLVLIFFNGLAGFCVITIKKLPWLAASLVVLLAVINITAMLLFAAKIIFPVLYINLGFIITAGALVAFQYLNESKEKKFIYNSFKYYLSQEVIEELIKDPKKLKLGGERKKITVFFSDIRGFTTMSESMTPENLTHVLGEYMTEMTDIIMARQGLVAQYFGDGIMAFWGAPLPNANQAERACASSLAMLEALAKLNQHFVDKNICKPIAIGIGLHTGDVMAGNIGSKKKFNYTAFGDGVNLTSRLEGLNKEYGTSIIISESTKKELPIGGEFMVRELDTIMVKGKKTPTTIFELLVKPLPVEIEQHFAEGKQYYQQGKWVEAIKQFELAGDDGPSKCYLKRCQEFLKNPPEHWNGIYEFKTK